MSSIDGTITNKQVLYGYGSLFFGILMLSISPLGVKLINAPGIITSFYRMAFASIVLSPFAVHALRQKKNCSEKTIIFDRKNFIFPVIAGLSSAVDHSLWSTALESTNVSNASMLNSVAPLWIAIIALIFFHEKYKRSFWLGLISILIGIYFMSGRGLSIFVDGFSFGDGLALLSSFFYCSYYIFTQLGRRYFPTMIQVWASTVVCSFGILIIALFRNLPLFGYSFDVWLLFFSLSMISQIGGYFGITYALGNLPASVVSPTSELQSVISALLAIPILHEMITPKQAVGCFTIVLGVVLVNRARIGSFDLSDAKI